MGSGRTNCQALWRPWYVILTSALEVFLIYSGIQRYVAFKSQAFDPKYGANWQTSGMNFALAMLICALFHFCLFIYTNLWRTTNLANEGSQIHRNPIYAPYVWPPSEVPRGTLDATGIGGVVGGGFGGFYGTMNGLMNGKNSLGMMARAGTPEDEHLTAASGGAMAVGAGPLVPLGATFDTWSARSAVPPSEFGNPYVPHAFRSTITGGTLATVSYKCRSSWWRRCWGSAQMLWTRTVQNFVPISSFLHLLSAYALYLCLPILQAQLIYHRALPKREMWLSDLSRIMSKVTDNCERGNFCADSLTWDMSMEFFNLLVAFAAIAVRYPSVFWRANRAFSFLFSFLLVLLGIQALVEVSAANVLVKLCWNQRTLRLGESAAAALAAVCTEVPAPKPPPPAAAASTSEIPQDRLRTPLFLDDTLQESAEGLQSGTPLFLSVSSSLLMVCLAATIFDYGLQQLPSRLTGLRTCALDGGSGGGGGCRAEHGNTPTSGLEEGGSADSAVVAGGLAVATGSQRDFSSESVVGGTAPAAMAGSSTSPRRNFFAHLVAVLGSLVVLAIKVPLVVACIQIFQVRRENLLLANVIITILFFCVWFIAWFAFCLKPTWNFKVSCPAAPRMTYQHLVHQPMRNLGLTAYGTMTGSGPGGTRSLRAGTGLCPGVVNSDLGSPRAVAAAAVARLASGSPVYDCYHDDNGGGPPICRVARVVSRAAAAAAAGGNGDCYSEGTEASSRQSVPNNYVCLQSGLNSGSPLPGGNQSDVLIGHLPSSNSAGLGFQSTQQQPPPPTHQQQQQQQQPSGPLPPTPPPPPPPGPPQQQQQSQQQSQQQPTLSQSFCGPSFEPIRVTSERGELQGTNQGFGGFERQFAAATDTEPRTDFMNFGTRAGDQFSFNSMRCGGGGGLDFSQNGAGEAELSARSPGPGDVVGSSRKFFQAGTDGNSCSGTGPAGTSCASATAPQSGGLQKPSTLSTAAPRVTFKEVSTENSPTDAPSNPSSSNDSGIDNQGTLRKNSDTGRMISNFEKPGDLNGGGGGIGSRFSAQRSGLTRGSLPLPYTGRLSVDSPGEPTYYNQDQVNAGSSVTNSAQSIDERVVGPGASSSNVDEGGEGAFAFERCPSMPPLNLPRLEGFGTATSASSASNVISYPSLSRRFNLGRSSAFKTTLVPGDGSTTGEDGMARSMVITADKDRSGLCSQV